MFNHDTQNDRSAEGLVYKLLTSSTLASSDMAINATASVYDFKYTCTNPNGCHVSRILVQIADGSINNGDFGGISGGLTTGSDFFVEDTNGSSLLNFLDGQKLKKNADFVLLAGTDVDRDIVGGADQRLSVRWTISRTGKFLLLKEGQSITYRVADNLSSISELRMMAQGYEL